MTLLNHTVRKSPLLYLMFILLLVLTMAFFTIPENQSSDPVVTIQGQVLIPSKTWSWKPTVTGTLPLSMVNFSDTLPASCSGGAFAFGTERLFNSYSLLLNLIDEEHFEPKQVLIHARELIKPPSQPPASASFTPLGWTKTTDGSGMLRWTPAYSISQWSDEWVDQITKGSNPQTIRIPIQHPISLKIGHATPLELPLHTGSNYLEISAQAWNRIKITPGAWFNSSLLKFIKESRPLLQGGVNLDSVMGANGLLHCRVSELIVAYQPTVELTAFGSVEAAIDRAVTTSNALTIGNIKFNRAEKSAEKSDGINTIYSLSSDSKLPIMIAVNVVQL
ncbi:hypothetical protein [Photobacterium sp. TY1-4]|uniref:hypothetical protein n=1 Tax=Photobacterium sp. TY1-4 TaxID=2899122 RepID=UPI0021C20CD1|nr:hypothetical protein [Photobacterium sp. TY1-4]UXI02596.1 hypothetical protein NH461_07485 [Photobacterium sp. TY1-4]